MSHASRILSVLALAVVNPLAAQITLQDFSSVVGPNTFFYGSWEATGDAAGSVNKNSQFSQGVGVFNFTGTNVIIPTNSADSKVEFFYTTPASIGSNSLLSVTAQSFATNLATSFEVTLKDTLGATAAASFTTASFPTGSYTTATGLLTLTGLFNGNSIDSMIISGGQPGGLVTFNVSFDNISAVPEPSTYAAIFGASVFGVVAAMRRRRKV